MDSPVLDTSNYTCYQSNQMGLTLVLQFVSQSWSEYMNCKGYTKFKTVWWNWMQWLKALHIWNV